MSVDYDLIIWGGSAAGISAAVMAAQHQARVALILPPEMPHWGYQYHHCLTLPHRLRQFSKLSDPQISSQPLSYEDLSEWVEAGVQTLSTIESPAALELLGVDVIREWGDFYRKGSQPVIDLSSRRLLASSYLLAPQTYPRVEIEGLISAGYLTPGMLESLETLPSSLGIIGSDPRGVEFAQLFQELGCQVTLIVRESRILLAEEPEASELIQVQLEALGVRILTDTQVTQARPIDGQTWLQVGNRAIAVDKVLLVTPPALPLGTHVLTSLGIGWGDKGLMVNNKLQTTNPQIYACGESIGGYSFPHLSRYEAKIAVKNALIAPLFNIEYSALSYTINSRPTLARVGLTEAGARQRYGNIQIIEEEIKTNPAAILSAEIIGFIKIILRPNGLILGATIIGFRAEEMIYTLSLAIRHQIKLQNFQHSRAPLGSISEELNNGCDRWNTHRLNQSYWSQTILKWWLSWKRG